MLWTCSFWIADVKGNGIVSACFIKAEDTSIHRKGTHLFIHMGNLETFTLMVVQKNLTSDIKVIFCRSCKVKLAKEEGYVTFPIPSNVGGRYSVFTACGLLPMAVAGIDIRSVMAGARRAETELDVRSMDNPAWLYAAARNLMYENGKKIEMLCSYEPDFEYVGRWWQQLFGESEGKDGKGIFPACAQFTTDLHSMGQMIQQGERTLFETVVRFQKEPRELKIETDWKNMDDLNYLAGKTVDYVEENAYQGVVTAHVDGGVPVLVLKCGPMNSRMLGYLLYFFQLSCGISAYLLGVNPFNQPGVEAYKKNMMTNLGR